MIVNMTKPSWCDISIDPGCGISAGEAYEFVELFYPGSKPGKISVLFLKQKGKKRMRGLCMTMGNVHQISVFYGTISGEIDARKPGEKLVNCGGNRTQTDDARVGCFLTLAHELRHAYQHEIHWTKEGFFAKRGYMSRPCEVDARRYVDESYTSICGFLNVTPDPSVMIDRGGQQDNSEALLEELIGVLMECEAVSIDDVRHELSAIGLNNSVSLGIVVRELADEGIVVS